MTDITKIPMSELLEDLAASYNDIAICKLAELHGIDKYSGGTVKDRIDGNKFIIAKIEQEIKRRAILPPDGIH